MVKKKVDSRIRTLIENGVQLRHRTLVVVVGDRGRDQVVNLHYMLSKAAVRARPSVLWCYDKDLGFIAHRQKRMQKMKRDIKRGIREVDEENPFELFIASTEIRYSYYRETHKILGNTFGMCVLQDFQALTPNLLARTVETVEGGGLVVLLLRTMSSLRQLYTMAMDVHERFRTESHGDVAGRFNERFLLSLASCERALVVDDELNLLPLSSHMRDIKRLELPPEAADDPDALLSPAEKELRALKQTMKDTPPVGLLVEATRTLDQARAVLTFAEAISAKRLRTTVVLTAARGRGKSAALGLAVAGAVAFGYSNIFVTAPSPENLHTLFEMIFKGFDALGYREHLDYEIVQSTNPELNKAVVRVNVFRAHRQTIQYISPQDHLRLAQAELLVIDEAAAIPLPMVKRLMGNYLVFLSSTVNGYEGTGRSLSLKLVKDLRRQVKVGAAAAEPGGARDLREITLEEPIRYATGDPVERWLNALLCLDCTKEVPPLLGGTPHPSQCELYYVNRDTLFSYHPAAEAFLQRMMALFVSSHYRNTPNDLQLMSDAPAHHLFVLLGPVDRSQGAAASLPDVLCAVQVCLEGQISRSSVEGSFARGRRSSGDLIPWTVAQQFQDPDFAALAGARVVRIATHPGVQRMGYATRALQLLRDYYEGGIAGLGEALGAPGKARAEADKEKKKKEKEEEDEEEEEDDDDEKEDNAAGRVKEGEGGKGSRLLTEVIKPRPITAPLLEKLAERPPESLHYLGVSFGVTLDLFNFWVKSGFAPLYLRLTPNELTGEHTCIMLRELHGGGTTAAVKPHWLDAFVADFRRRFVSLLAYDFRLFAPALALSVVLPPTPAAAPSAAAQPEGSDGTVARPAVDRPLTFGDMREWFLEFDLRRLESYARNLVDYHMVLDLVPHMARLYFCGRLPVTLSAAQSAILLSLGLQHKSVSDVEAELGLASNQVLALFNKAVRKISLHLRGLEESAAARDVAAEDAAAAAAGGAGPASAKKPTPLREPLQRELKDAAKKHAQDSARAAQLREAAPPVDLAGLEHYAIAGSEQDWDAALGKGGVVAPATISVRSSGDKAKRREQQLKRAARGEAPDADKGAHQHKKGRTQ